MELSFLFFVIACAVTGAVFKIGLSIIAQIFRGIEKISIFVVIALCIVIWTDDKALLFFVSNIIVDAIGYIENLSSTNIQ